MRSFSVVVLGDLCVDIVARDRLPFSFRDPDSADEPAAWIRLVEQIGGSAYHFARWAPRYQLNPTVVGCVGTDPAGQLLVEACAAEGIAVHLERSSSARTALVLIAYDAAGSRVLIASSESANDELSPDFVLRTWPTLAHVDLVWLSGLCLRRRDTSRMRAVIQLLHSARHAGVPIVLDIVPHEFWRCFSSLPEVETTIGRIDGIVSELAAARRLLGVGTPGENLNVSQLPETVERALELTDLAVLRLMDGGVWYQVARSRGGFQVDWAHPLPDPQQMRGFGDSLACEAMSAYLKATAGSRPGGGNLSTETVR